MAGATITRVNGVERPPAVAGRFYDRDPRRLRDRVSRWLSEAAMTKISDLRGVIVPHAGHVYSGPVAASGYRLLNPHRWGRVLMLGPAHFAPVPGLAASRAERWITPLGSVQVDTDLVAGVVAGGAAEYDDGAHAPEHCLEVQLPLLQVVLGTAWTLVPLLVGHAPAETVADVIDTALDDETLLVVSTDLSHYLPYDDATRVDALTAQRIVNRSANEIRDPDACGAYALRGALTWARQRDVAVELLDLRNSGDTAGDRSRVVGYGAFAVSRR